MSLNESTVEDAALTWFGELGYAIGHGPQLAPGEPAAERASFGDVLLVGRLREAIRRLNPAIPEDAREEAVRKLLRLGTPSLTQTNRAFHRMLRDGVPVEYPRADGSVAGDHVRLVDFGEVRANDWLAMNQLISRKLLGRDATADDAPVILNEFANTASAGSIIAFHRHHDDIKAGDVGVICSFGAGYSIGSAVLRRV